LGGDLLSGAGNSHIATLVERSTRFTKLVKVGGKDTVSVVGAISKQIITLPSDLRRTLTWDRGAELAQHRRFTIETNVKVFFCDPKAHGSEERTRTQIASCASISPTGPT
jgi:IS30 family transposase